VPWVPVRKWLRSNCGNLKEYRIVRSADHNVLSTGCFESAEQIISWIKQAHPSQY
jgi:hypothetical protein